MDVHPKTNAFYIFASTTSHPLCGHPRAQPGGRSSSYKFGMWHLFRPPAQSSDEKYSIHQFEGTNGGSGGVNAWEAGANNIQYKAPFCSRIPSSKLFPGQVGINLNPLTYKRPTTATAASPATHGLTLQTLHFLGNLFHGKLEKPRQDDGRGRVLYCLRRRTLIRSDPNKRIRPCSVQTPGNSVECISCNRIVSACLAPRSYQQCFVISISAGIDR